MVFGSLSIFIFIFLPRVSLNTHVFILFSIQSHWMSVVIASYFSFKRVYFFRGGDDGFLSFAYPTPQLWSGNFAAIIEKVSLTMCIILIWICWHLIDI